jgi:hypothetical protein
LVTWETISPQKTGEFDMAESVVFEPQNVSELKRFFEDNKQGSQKLGGYNKEDCG